MKVCEYLVHISKFSQSNTSMLRRAIWMWKGLLNNELYYKSNIMYSNILMSKHLVMYHTTQRSLFALALFNWRNLEKSCHLDIRCMYHICASIILLHWNCLLWILIFLLWLNDIEFLFRKFNDFLCNLSNEKKNRY